MCCDIYKKSKKHQEPLLQLKKKKNSFVLRREVSVTQRKCFHRESVLHSDSCQPGAAGPAQRAWVGAGLVPPLGSHRRGTWLTALPLLPGGSCKRGPERSQFHALPWQREVLDQ